MTAHITDPRAASFPKPDASDPTRALARLVVDDLEAFSTPDERGPTSYARALNVPWCDSPFLEQRIREERIAPDLAALARKFARDGYLIIDPGLPEPELDATVHDMGQMVGPSGESIYSGKSRVPDGWRFSEGARHIATHRGILDLLYVLYRRQPIPFQTLNFPVGTEQRTHSDTIHFHSLPHHFMCGVWMALEDVDLDNGPLHVYPGSHRLPLYDFHDLGITAASRTREYEHYPFYEDFVAAMLAARRVQPVEVKLKKGQGLVWAANLFHGGSPIVDRTRSRHSQVTHYLFSDCAFTTPLFSDAPVGRTHLRDVVNIKNGQRVPQYYNGQRILDAGQWPVQLAGLPVPPDGPVEPLEINTTARHRIAVWPRWDDPADVRRLFTEFGRWLAGREDVCLCLRFDRSTDRPFGEAMALLERTCSETIGTAPLEVLLVNDDLSQRDWPRVGAAMTGALGPGGPRPSAQWDFVGCLGVPILQTGEALARHLGARTPPAALARAARAAA